MTVDKIISAMNTCGMDIGWPMHLPSTRGTDTYMWNLPRVSCADFLLTLGGMPRGAVECHREDDNTLHSDVRGVRAVAHLDDTLPKYSIHKTLGEAIEWVEAMEAMHPDDSYVRAIPEPLIHERAISDVAVGLGELSKHAKFLDKLEGSARPEDLGEVADTWEDESITIYLPIRLDMGSIELDDIRTVFRWKQSVTYLPPHSDERYTNQNILTQQR